MKLLIDTHIALWLFNKYENISPIAQKSLRDINNDLYFSIISAWEIAIKHSLGKLPNYVEGVSLFLSAINNASINIISVLPSHIEIVEKLPYIHHDPFDRLLISTAISEGMTIITADKDIHKYNVDFIW